ncbi:MAG: type I DNA topoisomerase, partial [Planctomycetota bacterium]
DRMMGYKLSPLLWRRAGPGLSAGRVQTVALRLIVEKEREIRAFIPEVYWTIEARFAKEGAPPTPPAPEPEEEGVEPGPPPVGEGEFLATLLRVNDEKIRITDEKVGTDLLERLAKADFRISKVVKERKKEHPKPPFTTSTMQQQGATRLRFTAKRTMSTAQRLYQGVELGKEGQVALITYMRTDSVALSNDAVEEGRRHIADAYGDKYLPEKPKFYKAGKRAQEAHEAIRPTDPARTPEMIKGLVGEDEFRLYDLIWRRFMACQMTAAETDVTTVTVEAEGCAFESRGRTPAFDGWRRVLPQKKKDEAVLPPLDEGEVVEDRGVTNDRHETQPPPRFTEASLVRTLEKEGIGRPSTYASIISTIVDRNYVLKERTRFRPTALGEVVNDLLVPFFEDILDPTYTSRMEEELDEVEDAKTPWKKVLKDFWKDFAKDLKRAEKDMKPLKFLPAPEGTDPCEKCGSDMVRKIWKGSEFLGCSKYPDCKNTRKTAADGTALPPPEETDHVCKKCEKPMVIRSGRRGRFLACTGYPDCKNTADVDDDGNPMYLPDVDEKCEKCDSDMVAKMGRRGPFMACSGYPKCKNAKDLPGFEKKKVESKEAGVDCEECGKPMQIRMSRRGPFAGCTGYPKCRKTLSMDKLEALKAQA